LPWDLIQARREELVNAWEKHLAAVPVQREMER
jgi:hypothetical protein